MTIIGRGLKGLANSLPHIAAGFLGMNFLGAWLFMIIEKSYSYGDSLYWAFITSLSIGYGDISPSTPAGRVVAVLMAVLVLIVIIPLIVGKFVMSALEDQHQFTHDEQEEIKTNIGLTSEKLTAILDELQEIAYRAKD